MVGIVIICYNLDARVFLLQVDAIKKFCKDEYALEIFDNSSNEEKSEGIRYHCDILGISYRKTQSASRNGSESHSFAAGVAYELLKDRYDWFCFLDHDCIPVKPFSVIEILGAKLMAGLGQQGQKKFFWPGCVMWTVAGVGKEIIDFKYDHTYKLDTGGGLYKVIEKYGEDNMIFFNEVYCELENFTGKMAYYSMINDSMFLHFVGSSNWERNERHEERINTLLNIGEQMINNVD